MELNNLIWINNFTEPGKKFIITDLNMGGSFLDPLIYFSNQCFNPDNADTEGLYAIGGHIDPETLKLSYKWGIFPWFPYKSKEVMWYCPKDRFVIFPDEIHISHSMRTLFNKKEYRVTYNTCFEEVIRWCSCVDGRKDMYGAWLGPKMIDSFLSLHSEGIAKSVEVWRGEKLIGGFYGTLINGVFQGESMFSLEPSASKYALIAFCQSGYLGSYKIKLIDTQFETPLFKALGARFIDYADFRHALDF